MISWLEQHQDHFLNVWQHFARQKMSRWHWPCLGRVAAALFPKYIDIDFCPGMWWANYIIYIYMYEPSLAVFAHFSSPALWSFLNDTLCHELTKWSKHTVSPSNPLKHCKVHWRFRSSRAAQNLAKSLDSKVSMINDNVVYVVEIRFQLSTVHLKQPQ